MDDIRHWPGEEASYRMKGMPTIIDGASQVVGISAGTSMQLGLPNAPIVAGGAGYAVGSYATSLILTTAVDNYNPIIFRSLGLGGD